MELNKTQEMINLNTIKNQDTDINLHKQKEAAKKFEAIFLRQLFSIMEKSMGGGKLFGNGFSGKIYKDLFIDKLSEKSVEGRGIGIADLVLKYWRRSQSEVKDNINSVKPSSVYDIMAAFNQMKLEKEDE